MYPAALIFARLDNSRIFCLSVINSSNAFAKYDESALFTTTPMSDENLETPELSKFTIGNPVAAASSTDKESPSRVDVKTNISAFFVVIN